MPARGSVVMTASRKELIDGLQRVGGVLRPAKGKVRIAPAEVKERLGLSCPSGGSVTSLLARAEKDGLIRREVHGRSTKAVYLVHGKRRGPGRPKKEEAAKRKYTRRNLPPKLPEMGEMITVAMIAQDRDGQITLGLRSMTGAWVVTVNSFVAAEAESE